MGVRIDNFPKRKLPKFVSENTLIVSSSLFFIKRKGTPTEYATPYRFSESMLVDAANKYHKIYVFERTAIDFRKSMPDQPLYKMCKDLHISNIKLYQCLETASGKITNYFTARLKELHIGIKRMRNPRQVTYLNLGHYIDDPRVTYVGAHDHDRAGILLEKGLTFKELEKVRESRSSW